MPRGLNEPDPQSWIAHNGKICRDSTRRRRDGKVDRRCNNSWRVVAQVKNGAGEDVAKFIAKACRHAESNSA